MKAEELKKSILQYALQGKLVEQNPNDISVNELLLDISAEKERLITEGVVNKKLRISLPIEQDEVLFEIPEHWKWVRFSDIVNFKLGKTPPRKNETFWGNDFPWVTISDMVSNGDVYDTKESISTYAYTNTFGQQLVPAETLLMSFKLTIGKVSILKTEAVHNEAIISIYPYINDNFITRDYLFTFLPILSQMGQKKNAIMGKTLNSDSLSELPIPLPPLEEQRRIVDRLEELFYQIEEYDKIEKELSEIEKKFPSDLKKSILQYALQGKLVEQNPNDTPVSELLLEISTEKERLIAEKKIKKSNSSNDINEDEVPFEIPDSWEWVRLGACVDLYTGNSISESVKKSRFSNLETGFNYIATKDISFSNNIDYDNGIKIPFDEPKFKYAYSGATLMCIEGGSAGKKFGYLEEQVCFGNKLCAFHPIIFVSKYLYYYLQSPIFQDFFKKAMNGMIGGVGTTMLKTMLIPLPPIEEQQRIVDKIEEVFELAQNL